MNYRKWSGLRCSDSEYAKGEIRVTGGFGSRVFEGQLSVSLFSIILCVLISQTGLACETDSTLNKLGNATYTGIEDLPLSLANGQWEGAPYVEGGASRPRVGLNEDIYLTGDLDADGEKETVAILWQSAGGTGSNIYIAVMKSENDGYENIATALIGDRVKLRGGEIDSGKIYLDVLQAGDNDAMCCPTQLATRNWNLQDNQLEEGEMEVTGVLSLSLLEGSEWQMRRMTHEQSLPAEAEVTLAVNEGRIAGKSACNRYSAEIKDGDKPGDILIGPTMGTKMACPDPLMEVEQQYLESLAQVKSFSFASGDLVLNGQKEDGALFSMHFIPVGKEHH